MTFLPGQKIRASDLNNLETAVLGGTDIMHTANLGSTITTTETVVSNMTTGSINLVANRRYLIEACWKAVTSVANDIFVIRIRDTNTVGTLRAEGVLNFAVALSGFQGILSARYETTNAETKDFVFTAVRAGGTGNIQFSGAGTGVRLGVVAYDLGPSSRTTVVT